MAKGNIDFKDFYIILISKFILRNIFKQKSVNQKEGREMN